LTDASVIVVNYRAWAHLVECLACLDDHPVGEVFVVDNSPVPGRAERLPEKVHYLAMDRNVGFAAAVNAAASRATGDYLILLNPDARPLPGCIAGLCDALADGAVAAAPALLPFDEGDSPAPCATRRDPDFWTTLVEYTAAHRLVPKDWLARRYFLDAHQSRRCTCAMLQGACLAVRRSWMNALGGLDERFFLYWEDSDLCRRIRDAGGTVLFCPDLLCRHEGGASLGGGQHAGLFWRGLFAYHRKHSGRVRTAILRGALVVGIAGEWAILSALDLWRGGRDATLAADRVAVLERLRLQLQLPAST
jgi:GT2 family glycosyltransferase